MKREPNRLRLLRAEHRITQIVLSRKSGVQPARISLIENGHVEPTDGERARLAKALGADVAVAFPAREAIAS